MTAAAMPELGDRVRNKFNGFTGIVTARTESLGGEVTMQISPERLTNEGSLIDPAWFPSYAVEIVQKGKAATG